MRGARGTRGFGGLARTGMLARVAGEAIEGGRRAPGFPTLAALVSLVSSAPPCAIQHLVQLREAVDDRDPVALQPASVLAAVGDEQAVDPHGLG